MKKLLMALFILGVSAPVRAQEVRALSGQGLGGEGLTAIAVVPGVRPCVLLGTTRGVYRFDPGRGSWERFCASFPDPGRVNEISFVPGRKAVYVATDKGLLETDPQGRQCSLIFERSQALERDCLSVAETKEGALLIGTRGGLFIRRRSEEGWSKIASPFERDPVVSVCAQGDVAYAAGPSDVYSSSDQGRTWSKVFNLYLVAEAQGSPSDEEAQEGAVGVSAPLRHLIGLAGSPGALYVATHRGVFGSKDAGQTWDELPRTGLDIVNLRYLAVEPDTNTLLAVAKSGVYGLQKEGWAHVLARDDARQMAFAGEDMLVMTAGEVVALSVSSLGQARTSPEGNPAFSDEPTVQEVQEMVIRYCDISNEKIRDWRRAASLKALLPKFSYDRDKTVTTALGATYDRTQIGPLDWGLTLSWDFSDLVYNESQTSIDSRAKLMLDQRNDILSEVTRLYFERRKLQIELDLNKGAEEKNLTDKRLRMMEVTALIDRLTGGTYSKVLKSR